MNAPSCAAPLDWTTLLAYWLGEQDAATEARTEEHYFGCEQCSHRLEELASLAEGVRATLNSGEFNAVLTEHFVQLQKDRGQHVRTYRVPRNGSVNCTIAPDDDLVVAHLEAPLADITRLDLIFVGPGGTFEVRREDIPFIAASGNVPVAISSTVLRALPTSISHMRLLTIDNHGERLIGEYTFNHTAYAELGR